MERIWNVAPYPDILKDLVSRLKYREGWKIKLVDKLDRGQGSEGITLVVTTQGYDSYNPNRGETYRVNHYMPVPPAAFNEKSWRRWLLDQLLLVERHEACEFFKIDGKRPYAPLHGPGNDPYIIFERSTDEEVRTMYTGEVKPAPSAGAPTPFAEALEQAAVHLEIAAAALSKAGRPAAAASALSDAQEARAILKSTIQDSEPHIRTSEELEKDNKLRDFVHELRYDGIGERPK